jgi:phosphatidate cytidylyltransferase
MADTLTHRIFSAAIFVPVILLSVWFGDLALFALVLAIVVRGSWEFYTVATTAGFRPLKHLGIALSLIICSYIYFAGCDDIFLVLCGVVLVCLACGLSRGVEQYTVNTMLTLGGVLYLGFLGSAPLFIMQLAGELQRTEAAYLLMGLFCCLWCTDSMAYACGRLWGQRKLAPSISPGKTLVGFVGGLVGGVVPVLLHTKISLLSFAELIGILLICSASGQLGDLVESAFKRDMGVKDAPPLIPGHGGVLDRFDSYLVALPLAFLYLECLDIFNR